MPQHERRVFHDDNDEDDDEEEEEETRAEVGMFVMMMMRRPVVRVTYFSPRHECSSWLCIYHPSACALAI